MKKILLCLAMVVIFAKARGEEVRVVSTEGKGNQVVNWIETKGMVGKYRCRLFYTYDWSIWYEIPAAEFELREGETVGVGIAKNCFPVGKPIFWRYKFIKR